MKEKSEKWKNRQERKKKSDQKHKIRKITFKVCMPESRGELKNHIDLLLF